LRVKGSDAQALLKEKPLLITFTETQAIDKAVKAAQVSQLESKYNSAPGNKKKFSEIPAQSQTIIASVPFQYGAGLDSRAPMFWKAVTSQDWNEATKVLKILVMLIQRAERKKPLCGRQSSEQDVCGLRAIPGSASFV
jgi:hypothetical protein